MNNELSQLAIIVLIGRVIHAIPAVPSTSKSSQAYFEQQLETIKQDKYPIQKEAGPVINPEEIEVCRNVRFQMFKVGGNRTKYFATSRLRWRAANECCRLHGKVLTSEFTNRSLEDYRNKVDDGDSSTDVHDLDAAWTSASNIINARLYEWQSGEDFESGIWGPGEPNNRDDSGNPEGCGHLFYDNKYHKVAMNDWSCFQKNHFICEDEHEVDWTGTEVQEQELEVCRDLAANFSNYGTRYYHQKRVAVRWKLADKCCKLHNLTLLSMDDSVTGNDYDALRLNIHTAESHLPLTWTSGNDFDKTMDYIWASGESIYKNGQYSPEKKFCFFENYPQNYHPNRHCIQIRSYNSINTKGRLEDGLRYRNVQCSLLRDFICQAERGPNASARAMDLNITAGKRDEYSITTTPSPKEPSEPTQNTSRTNIYAITTEVLQAPAPATSTITDSFIAEKNAERPHQSHEDEEPFRETEHHHHHYHHSSRKADVSIYKHGGPVNIYVYIDHGHRHRETN